MTKTVALVTGGIGGLGTAMCEVLSAEGMLVYANYLPGMDEAAAQWQENLQRRGTQCEVIAADVTSDESCEAMAAQLLEKHATVAVLVNNAGITRDASLRNLSSADWQAVIDTNLSSLFRVTKPLLEPMITTGYGRIVNVSSVNGRRGQFGQTNYSAAKAGVHGFTKALAQEVARKGITVNTLSPGFIDTDMVKTIPADLREKVLESIPVGRIGQPEEIARAVAFLCNAQSGYITGHELCVNGGVHMF